METFKKTNNEKCVIKAKKKIECLADSSKSREERVEECVRFYEKYQFRFIMKNLPKKDTNKSIVYWSKIHLEKMYTKYSLLKLFNITIKTMINIQSKLLSHIILSVIT